MWSLRLDYNSMKPSFFQLIFTWGRENLCPWFKVMLSFLDVRRRSCSVQTEWIRLFWQPWTLPPSFLCGRTWRELNYRLKPSPASGETWRGHTNTPQLIFLDTGKGRACCKNTANKRWRFIFSFNSWDVINFFRMKTTLWHRWGGQNPRNSLKNVYRIKAVPFKQKLNMTFIITAGNISRTVAWKHFLQHFLQ